MNLQSETHISSLVDELDFEDEANISNSEEESNMMKGSNIDAYELERIQQTGSKSGGIKYEGYLNDLEDGEISDNNLNKKETCISLLEELVFDIDAMPVNKKMPNTSIGNIIDVNEFKELQQSESETLEIENEEELNDLEEGEISESNSIKKNGKTVCRYFKHGTCFYGSHCQFLHVSDNVYNMFNSATSYKRSLKAIVPCFFPPEIENPVQLVQNNKTAWEKGLENAKAMIQKALCKRIDDKEFENKKLYISSNSFTSDVSQDRDPNFKTNVKSTLNLSPNIEPLKANSLRFALHKTIKQKQSIDTSNCFNVEKSSCEYKWVDPWMRSKSPRKRKRCKSHSSLRRSRKKEFNRALSSSSSSSIERIYRGSEYSKKLYKKRSPTSKFNIKLSHKSYSRSFSRSASRSCSRKRCQSCSSWSRSPVGRRTFKKKRSTSLEKWFKRRHHIASDSRSSSRSSILSFRRSTRNISPKCNSDNESWSSMTVSSILCSYSSSSSDSPKSQSNRLKSSIRNEFSNSNNFTTSRNATEANSLYCLQSKKPPLSGDCVKDKSLSSHTSISASKERESVSSSYKSTSAKVSKTLVTGSPSSCVITKDTASQLMTLKPVSELPSKPPAIKAISKDNFSSTLNCLRYKSIADSYASNHAAISKPISPAVNSVPSSQASDGINSSQVPDNKRTFSCVSKRTITLNLQPKSQNHLKLSEVLYKKQNLPGTVCNLENGTSNKRETLLKQLKLVEDAISRKKRY